MFIDSRLRFANALAVPTAIGAAAVGDTIDAGADGAIGNSDGLYLVVNATAAFTSAGAATVAFELVSDVTPVIGAAPTVHASTAAIPVASLIPGFQIFKVELPIDVYNRYLAVRAVVAAAVLTAGSIDAFITNDPFVHRIFPDGLV